MKQNTYYRFWKYSAILRLVLDALLIPVAVILAYGAKFKLTWFFQTIFSVQIGQVYSSAQIEPYLHVLGIIVLLWIVAFHFSGLYRPFIGTMPVIDEFVKLVKGASIATLEVLVVTFIFKVIPESRYVLFYTWLFGILILTWEFLITAL